MSPVPARVKRAVYRRAGERCEYCLLAETLLHPDHVTPRAAWGDRPGYDDAENLAAACLHCNSIKAGHTDALDPLTGRRVRLFDPRRDVWAEHFRWTPDFLRIVPLTPIGRATVQRLKLNRPVYLRHRRLLRAAARGGGDPWP